MPDPKTSESVLPDAQCRFLLTGFVSCRDDPLVRSCTRRGSLVVRSVPRTSLAHTSLARLSQQPSTVSICRHPSAVRQPSGSRRSRMPARLRPTIVHSVLLPSPADSAPQASLDECMIELEGRRGKIRIQLKGSGTAHLAELTRKFWDLAS